MNTLKCTLCLFAACLAAICYAAILIVRFPLSLLETFLKSIWQNAIPANLFVDQDGRLTQEVEPEFDFSRERA